MHTWTKSQADTLVCDVCDYKVVKTSENGDGTVHFPSQKTIMIDAELDEKSAEFYCKVWNVNCT